MKCDCGEAEKPHHPKEKCIHLREAEERAKAGCYEDHSTDRDANHLVAVAEEQGCCCLHGGRCTCAVLKKDSIDDPTAPHGPAVKPRLEKTTSDGAITVFTNGHHKPVHRKNHAAHECGMPYKMPMARASTEQSVANTARRSVDSLALDSSMQYQPSTFMSQQNAPYSQERRKSRSEEPSPKMPHAFGNCSGGLGDAKLQSIDFSTLSQTQTNQSINSTASESFGFPSFDPMTGVTDGSYDPWSTLPSTDSQMPNNNPFGVWPSNDQSHAVQPALTAASSGTTSEMDEVPYMEDMYGFGMPSIQEDSNFDFMSMATGNSPQLNRRSLPPGFFGNTEFSMNIMNNEWQTQTNTMNMSGENKQREDPPVSFSNPWQMSALAPTPNIAQRAIGGLPINSNRPQSRSIGPGSAPDDDVIKQLFPDIDINNTSMFTSSNSPQLMQRNLDKPMTGNQSSNVTSAPIDFDNNANFISQPWADGSMSVPNDTFTSSYDLDQEFSNPDFTVDWTR